MKKYMYKSKLMFLTCMILLVATSCDSWLDVKPKTEEEAESLFNSEEGFKSALAGAYIALCQPELYGRELTYGMVGVLGQEWKGGATEVQSSAYSNFLYYRLGETNAKAITESVWGGLYKTIANVNTLLEYTDKKRDVLRGDNYEIIRGEALALRAFIHFDLLRLYAEADFTEGAKPSIPYVKTSKPAITAQSKPAEVVKLIVADLDEALTLLVKDPIYTSADVSGSDNGYLANRSFHLNYYAVQGLKARVYLYANNLSAANTAAQIVITAQDGGLFPWVSKNDINPTNANLKDRTFSTEHLFALNTIKLNEYIKGYFKETTAPMVSRIDIKGSAGLYDVSDYRLKLFENDNSLLDVFSKFWQIDKQLVNGVMLPKRDRMPMLRISEMYYIAAEYLVTTDAAAALDKLNKVREMRGVTDKLTDVNPAAVAAAILKEYQGELLGEGQLFFYHKRKNTENIATAKAKYVLPMPDQEIDLGERE